METMRKTSGFIGEARKREQAVTRDVITIAFLTQRHLFVYYTPPPASLYEHLVAGKKASQPTARILIY